MTPTAAARSLLIADKVMSNNFVSRIRCMSGVQTESRLRYRPCIAGLASCAALAPCLALYFFGRRGGASEDLDDHCATVPHAQTDMMRPTSRKRERNVTLLPETIEVMLIFLSRHDDRMQQHTLLQHMEGRMGLRLSAL